MSALTLNSSITVLDVRFLASWRGAWLVEAELDLDPTQPVPSGQVTLNVFDQDLQGTIEPTGTGRFADRTIIRILAGNNGWNGVVAKKDFHNDANVTADAVIRATAAEIGETVVETPALELGVDYVRCAGQASRVLAGLDWYVDFDGKTHVASRPPLVAPSDIEALEYDPRTRTLQLGAVTSLVVPGMSFTDPNGRWDGALVVRDVEQHFTGDGEAHAIAFCGDSPSSQGTRALLERFVVEIVRPEFLKSYPYRIVDQGADGRLTLQAIKAADGVPDTVLISAWPGVPGASATFDVTLGDVVVLAFQQGDPAKPTVVSYGPSLVPLTLLLDVVTEMKLGKNATDFVALQAKVQANFDAVNTALVTTGLAVGGGQAKLANAIIFQPMGAQKVKAE